MWVHVCNCIMYMHTFRIFFLSFQTESVFFCLRWYPYVTMAKKKPKCHRFHPYISVSFGTHSASSSCATFYFNLNVIINWNSQKTQSKKSAMTFWIDGFSCRFIFIWNENTHTLTLRQHDFAQQIRKFLVGERAWKEMDGWIELLTFRQCYPFLQHLCS